MKIDLEELLSRLDHQESEICEFKVNNSNPDKLGATISALSNSAALLGFDEAYLIFGINNQGQIVGTKFNVNQQHKNQEIKNYLITQLKPATSFDIDLLEITGKRVVVFVVKAATLYPVKFKGQASIRVGSYTKPLGSHPEQEKALWQRLSHSSFEKAIALDDLHKDELLLKLAYEEYFKLKRIRVASDIDSIVEKLIDYGLVKHAKGRYSVTNLGALLAAKDIGDFEGLQRKLPRLIIYQDKNRIKATNDIISNQGYILCLPQIMQYLSDILPANEEIGRVFRQTHKLYPEMSLRELIVNALVHQDFSIRGVYTTIEVFSNRLEIRNPGQPLISTDRFTDSVKSRNELLIREMRLLDFCEERGSGIDRVLLDCEIYQLPPPLITTDEVSTKVTLYPPQALKQMHKTDKMRACYLHACLKAVNNEAMTNQSLRERLGISQKNYPAVSRIIKEALWAELIKKDQKRGGYIPYWLEVKA